MTKYGYVTVDAPTKTITGIDKSYEGSLVVEKTYGETDIEIIGASACKNGKISSLDLTKTQITKISNSAFLRCYDLKEVKLPDTLTSLELNSFGLTGITEFNLPMMVSGFTGGAVNQSPSLSKLTVSNDNPYFASKNNFIFSKDFSKLVRAPINIRFEDIPLIDGVQQINFYCFSGCTLKTFVATSQLTNLEFRAFHALGKLRYLDLRLSGITTLVSGIFWGTNNIETLILPRKLEVMEQKSIESLNNIKELIIPETVRSISVNAIISLKKLRNIYLLGSYYSGFENKEILGNYSDNVTYTKVHVSNLYENSIFAGFSVTNDLYAALNERMKQKLKCTLKKSHFHSILNNALF